MADPTDDDVSTDDGPDVEAPAPTDEAGSADADATGGVAKPTETKGADRRPDPKADVEARRAATAARMDAEKDGGASSPVSTAKASSTATADDPTGTKARRARAAGAGTATADDPTGAKARRAAASPKKVARPSKRTGAAPDPRADRAAARSGNPKKAAKAAESGRYTQPIPRSELESPVWVPATMFTLLGLGAVVILLTYVLWEGRPLTLGVGLALILGGILTATQYR